jgi:hypothetical protein
MTFLPSLLFLVLSTHSPAENLEPPSSAQVCGRCHRAIFEAWKDSSHAKAMESWLFQDALDLAEADLGASVRKTCLACHSPVGVATGDLALRTKVSWEGVTCDYCHSIRSVSVTAANPKANVVFSLVKSGPLKDVHSTAHGTEFSPIHTTALACAPCHEYRNSLGFPVLSTFSEWKNSAYAKEGKECQSCHMYQVAGNVVDPHIKRSSVAKINLHQMPGSHSLEQLTRTITAQLTTSRKGDYLQVLLEVANRTAGHYVPTGSPLRQLKLRIAADSSDGRHSEEERVYRRVVADSQGNVLGVEPLVFSKAAKVLSDSRLAPGEKRVETFSFPLPSGISAQLTATLRYYYSPMARTESQKQVTFLTITRLVR